MNIIVCDRIGQEGIDYLEKKGHTVIFLPEITPEELLSKVADAQALIVRGRTKVTQAVIEAGTKLKVVARSGTGVDNIDRQAAGVRNIAVVNAPGANAESVAEHAFAFMLALARFLVPTVNTLKGGFWAKSDFRGMELKGKTLGVVGLGHIGKRVAELGAVFGMDVLVFTRHTHKTGKQVTLPELLAASDFVSLHVPLTDETRGLMGVKEFGRMKKTAYFINTARGAIVDEEALITALKTRAIAGAALDVYATEPLPPESQLLSLSNVILTPHVAADSREGENRASLMVAEDVDRVLSGKEPLRGVSV